MLGVVSVTLSQPSIDDQQYGKVANRVTKYTWTTTTDGDKQQRSVVDKGCGFMRNALAEVALHMEAWS